MKPTDLKKMLPELNAGQLKWLERYVMEQRIDELIRHKYVDGIIEWHPRLRRKINKRIATLKQEAGL